jgi:hypothetical protein
MIKVPEAFAPHIKNNRLTITEGQFAETEHLAAYLKAQRNLTHIGISEDVNLPNQPNGASGHAALALALSQGHSPNVLEVSIAGANFKDKLAALTDGNRRVAGDLLTLARDRAHALSKNECERIKDRLPSMLALAEAHGATSTEHSMARPELLSALLRIGSHAGQHGIDTGVEPHIERLRAVKPATQVERIERAPSPVAEPSSVLAK